MSDRRSFSPRGSGDFFQLLRDELPRTRNELANITGLSRPTVLARIDDLAELRLIAPVSDAASTGGRPSGRIAFNPGAQAVVAADIGATHIHLAICDLAGTVLAERHVDMAVAEGPHRVLGWAIDIARHLLEELGRPASEIAAVGIGLPGPVDFATGRPSNPPIMPGWDGYDVPGHIRNAFAVPVLVDNDVNIMALGERTLNWGHIEDMMFVKVATGIGAGIISDGGLRRGANGAAGDIGHIAVPHAAGRPCRCGKIGCVEAYAGSPAIVDRLGEVGLDARTGADVVALVRAGNLEATRHVREAGRAIGEMLNACVSVVNPSVIVIGGLLTQSGENLLAGIREEVYAKSTPLATQDLTIAQSRAGGQAGVIGAGMLAIEYVLAPDYIDSQLRPRGEPLRGGSVGA
ncbi:ROK family transcriptional regulator [Microbacterium sp. LRZ72]|uniref:ROK family protein n=1 Tax=Microbacterium sp. LRZ72 TaxID=2942481 RepID=UPI0029A61893|nr:ROK family transcriptional regulator [Microbacterium sp. LRZ72]MDX2377826.1 ROK family transcriptional regulator [Microbacterium sp. LRZ72]